MNLCDDETAKILNGKVIPRRQGILPGKRQHVGNAAPGVHQVDFTGKTIAFTIDGNR